MQNILITGGAGFIGSHLVETLLARGDRVSVVDDESTGSAANLAAVWNHPRLSYVKGTVADEELVARLVADADEVYHLAAAVGVQLIAQSPIRTIETNIYTTELLLRQLGKLIDAGKTVKFFLASTSEVYGKNPKPQWTEEDDIVLGSTTRPRWSYGASKAIDEFLALAYWRERRLPVVVARLFNVVGPRQTGAYGMVLPRLVDAALAGRPLVVHDDGRQAALLRPRFRRGADDSGPHGRPGGSRRRVQRRQRPAGQHFGSRPAGGGGGGRGGNGRSEIRNPKSEIRNPLPRLPADRVQTYAEAYGDDFEDCRRRVPDLTKLRRLTGLRARYGLDDIIRELVAWKRGS